VVRSDEPEPDAAMPDEPRRHLDFTVAEALAVASRLRERVVGGGGSVEYHAARLGLHDADAETVLRVYRRAYGEQADVPVPEPEPRPDPPYDPWPAIKREREGLGRIGLGKRSEWTDAIDELDRRR
jgi:hypothetical protein